MSSERILIVETRAGKVRGALDRSSLGPEFCAFRGIPYARPPLAQLRFQDPVPVEPWNGIRDATKSGSDCTQSDFITGEIIGTEDCLYLNVYTRSCGMRARPLPVMVWIHGGGFVHGTGSDAMYGPDYFVPKDVVLVAINYRLGIFGFLDLEDEVAPGNQGLKDQVAALKWVRDNIANFGGDPDNVTIFGESAGSASVHYLTISPLAKGLFHKAIAQSGVIVNSWAYHTNPKERIYRLCDLLKFQSRDSKAIVDFLRTIDSKKLIEVEKKLLTNEEKIHFEFTFGPGVDAKSKQPFLPIPVEEAAKQGVHVPLIIGHNNLEGAFFAQVSGDDFSKYNYNFGKYLHPHAVNMLKRYNLSAEDVKRLYFRNEEISNDNREKLIELVGDMYFVEGVHRVVKMQIEAGSTPMYLYRYTYDKDPSPIKAILNLDMKGASHADELPYLFRARKIDMMTFDPSKKGTDGYRVMERLIDLWVNFATTGRPTSTTTEDMPFYWPPVNNPTVLRYLNIDEDLRIEAMLNLEQRYLTHKVTKNKL